MNTIHTFHSIVELHEPDQPLDLPELARLPFYSRIAEAEEDLEEEMEDDAFHSIVELRRQQDPPLLREEPRAFHSIVELQHPEDDVEDVCKYCVPSIL